MIPEGILHETVTAGHARLVIVRTDALYGSTDDPRWALYVTVTDPAGMEWLLDFTCGHLHKTRAVTRKCVRAISRRYALDVQGAERILPVATGVVEAQRRYGPGRYVLTRFTVAPLNSIDHVRVGDLTS